jgi:DNA-binding response OmpR family regulator
MKPARILVVDDDLWIQRTTASVLGQQGHQVSLAGDAPSAFALASRIRPDVVVTTVSLPALDGWSWWERLRALPACAQTPIVFLLPAGESVGEVAGAEPHDQRLRKPFRGEDLERTIVSVLGEQPVQTATSEAPPPRPQRSVDPHKPSAGHRPLSALRGELDQISLSSVLTVLEMERKNGILMVEHGGRESGRLFLRKGRIIRAEIDDPQSSGAPAVYQMLTWGAGAFDFLAGDVGGVDEIQASTTYLLMEGARRLDEAKAAAKPRALAQENKL